MAEWDKIKRIEVLKSKKDIINSVMDIAELWAENRSKDPKMKVGAAVYTMSGNVYLGYNGFPRAATDWKEIWYETNEYMSKHDLVVHAETNAIKKALASGESLMCSFMCVTLFPCLNCIKQCATANIEDIIYKDNKGITDKLIDIASAMRVKITKFIPYEEKDRNHA